MQKHSDHHVEERPQRLLRVSQSPGLLQEVVQRSFQLNGFHIVRVDHTHSL